MKSRAFIAFFIISAIASLFIKTEGIKSKENLDIIYLDALINNEKKMPKQPLYLSANFLPNNPSCVVSQKTKSALVKNLNADKTLFDFNASKRWSIASLTKLMTAVVVLEKIGKDKEIIFNEKAIATAGEAGDFKINDIFKANDLIKAMLLVSSNDAATALAEVINEKEFVKIMNDKAEELKMTETIFFNNSGLSFLNQSTPDDLVKLADYISVQHPEIFEISRLKETVIREIKTNKPKKLMNVNQFAGNADFLGGKSGYLESAGRNLISLFSKNNQPIIVVILGAEDAYKETENLLDCVNRY
ncbi:MAG: serine hydrolase [Patescibacteria group bacterium]